VSITGCHLLSDYSYRVRLLHMSYVDTDGRLDRDAERTVNYLIAYFEKAEDEEKLLGRFEKKCLGR
jgi:hypothetical protein